MKVIGFENGRVYEFWTARQRAGKTTAIKCRAVDMARHPSVTGGVWILDRLGEWHASDLPIKSIAVYHSFAELERSSELPRVVIWRLGENPDAYTIVLKEAAAVGDVCIIIDEAYEFAPSGARWTGTDELRAIVLAGAHLPRREDRELRPVHLIVAAQYPKSVHHMIWAQAYTVCVGVSSGENTFEWLRANFSSPTYDAVDEVASLRMYEWACVRGHRPPLPGYGENS